MKKIIDRYGETLRTGDTVKLVDIPLELLIGLTESEQITLRAEIGNMHLIQGASQHGRLQLEFHDTKGIPRTIFIRSSCVIRIPR